MRVWGFTSFSIDERFVWVFGLQLLNLFYGFLVLCVIVRRFLLSHYQKRHIEKERRREDDWQRVVQGRVSFDVVRMARIQHEPMYLFIYSRSVHSLFTILLHCLLIDNKLFFISRGVIALRVATTWIRLWGFYFIIKKFSSCFRFNFIFLLSKNAFSFVGEFVSRVMLDLIIWGKFWWFFFRLDLKICALVNFIYFCLFLMLSKQW